MRCLFSHVKPASETEVTSRIKFFVHENKTFDTLSTHELSLKWRHRFTKDHVEVLSNIFLNERKCLNLLGSLESSNTANAIYCRTKFTDAEEPSIQLVN